MSKYLITVVVVVLCMASSCATRENAQQEIASPLLVTSEPTRIPLVLDAEGNLLSVGTTPVDEFSRHTPGMAASACSCGNIATNRSPAYFEFAAFNHEASTSRIIDKDEEC